MSTLREILHGSLSFKLFSLRVFGDSVTDLSVGARSAAAASLCLFQVLEENRGVGDGS